MPHLDQRASVFRGRGQLLHGVSCHRRDGASGSRKANDQI